MLHAYVEKVREPGDEANPFMHVYMYLQVESCCMLCIVEYMLCRVRKLLQLCSKTDFRHNLLLLIYNDHNYVCIGVAIYLRLYGTLQESA